MKNYVEKMEARFTSWSAKVEGIVARAEEAEVGDFSAHIDELGARRAEARDKLAELKEAGEASWDYLRAELWIAWNELENTFDDFQRSFSKREKERNEGDKQERRETE